MWSSDAGFFESLLPNLKRLHVRSLDISNTLSSVLLHSDILTPSFFCNFSDISVMRFSEHTFTGVNVNLLGVVP
jgi:hypothetical protein